MESGPGIRSLDLPKSHKWSHHVSAGLSNLNTVVDGSETFMPQKTALIRVLT